MQSYRTVKNGNHQASDEIKGETMERKKDKWKKLYLIENLMDLLEVLLNFFSKY